MDAIDWATQLQKMSEHFSDLAEKSPVEIAPIYRELARTHKRAAKEILDKLQKDLNEMQKALDKLEKTMKSP